nr:hypothetical protein [Tanacetum cinerariifolium]
MTRSSNKDIIQTFDEPEHVFIQISSFSRHRVMIIRIHRNLIYFMSTKISPRKKLLKQYGNQPWRNTQLRPEMAMERFRELLLRCPQHYLTDIQKVILFYKGLDVPTRQILDFKGAIPSMKATDAMKAIQEMGDHSQKWHNGTSSRCRSTKTSDGLLVI